MEPQHEETIREKDLQIKMLRDQLEFTKKQLEEKDHQLEHYKGLVKTFQDLLSEVSGLGRLVTPPTQPHFDYPSNFSASKVHSFHDEWIRSRDKEKEWLHEDDEVPSKNRVRKMSLASAGERDDRERNSLTSLSRTQSLAPLSKSKAPAAPSSKIKKVQSMSSVEDPKIDMKFPELDQMVGQIYGLSKYQAGCRFLQKKLDEKDPTNLKIIFDELLEHVTELMTDPFGNYLFAKLVERCDDQQRDLIMKKIFPDIVPTAFDVYGVQSIQKIIPVLTESQVDPLIKALKASAIALIKHNKANYLVQYFLDQLDQKHNQWIYDSVAESLEEVAKDRIGCVIVKRCIDHATEEQKKQMIDAIVDKTPSLVQDPFGNYVVQHVLEAFQSHELCNRLIRTLLGNLTQLCIQKFSSNVVEKCLTVADKETCKLMLQEITDSEALPSLLNDRFANFVVQTALDVADETQRSALVKKILPHLGRHYSPYTKRLQKKILKI